MTIKQVVFVAAEETMVIGVFATKEKAVAACEEWAGDDAVHRASRWQRHDGKWERQFKRPDSDWLTLYVTECEVES